MSILFKNARILTVDDRDTVIRDGALLTRGDRIAWVGPTAAAPQADGTERTVDCGGGILMPGLINAHTHLAMTLLRGAGGDLPLHDWLHKAIFPLEENLTAQDCYWGSMTGIAEMLLSGTTSFLDMYFFMDETARAVEETGIRGCLCRGLTPDGDFMGKLDDVRAFYHRWQGAAQGRVTVRVAPHAEYTNTDEAMAAYGALARELGCGIHVHVSETRAEADGCRGRHGCSPVVYMERMGIFDRPCVAAHCVAVDEDDIRVLARHGVSVAHNPSSNMKLGSGVAPVTAMLKAGVNVALGTDGAASNNNLDMMEEMHVGALIAKGFTQDPTAFTARQTLRAATMGGARALGMEKELGSLTEGKLADLVLLKADSPALSAVEDAADAVVYSAGRADIRLTMVGGRILMENGRLPLLRMDEILYNQNNSARRLRNMAKGSS